MLTTYGHEVYKVLKSLAEHVPVLSIFFFFFLIECGCKEFPEIFKMPHKFSMEFKFPKENPVNRVFLEPVSCHLYMMRFVLSCWNKSSPKRKHGKYKGMQMICSKIFICHICQQRLLVIFANSNKTHTLQPTCISCWQAGSISS